MQLTLSDPDFTRLHQFIRKNYGIDLSRKKQLVSSRLSVTVQEMGFDDFTSFINDLLNKRDPEKLDMVLNKLTTNYTFFMREEQHYQFFEKVALPEIIKRHQHDKVLSIWSAGCSSGEEPYNISMYIKEFLGRDAANWDTRVLATDISQRALQKAKEGMYELPDTIPEKWKTQYFKPTGVEGRFEVAPAIKSNVIFRTFNLMDPIKFKLKFDIIFCRNVMIYFEQETKDALCRRFYDASAQGGYLFIGHSESIDKNTKYQTLAPATYQKK